MKKIKIGTIKELLESNNPEQIIPLIIHYAECNYKIFYKVRT